MGIFSKTCEYGLKAALFVAKEAIRTDEKVGVKRIAKAIDSPEAFTAKIMQILTRNEIIHSLKGPTGGFFVYKEELENIKLSDIVTALDGDEVFHGCGLGLEECNDDKPCPMHNKFKTIRNQLSKMLQTTSLLELANGLDSGLTFLKT